MTTDTKALREKIEAILDTKITIRRAALGVRMIDGRDEALDDIMALLPAPKVTGTVDVEATKPPETLKPGSSIDYSGDELKARAETLKGEAHALVDRVTSILCDEFSSNDCTWPGCSCTDRRDRYLRVAKVIERVSQAQAVRIDALQTAKAICSNAAAHWKETAPGRNEPRWMVYEAAARLIGEEADEPGIHSGNRAGAELTNVTPLVAIETAIQQLEAHFMPVFDGDKETRALIQVLKRKRDCLKRPAEALRESLSDMGVTGP